MLLLEASIAEADTQWCIFTSVPTFLDAYNLDLELRQRSQSRFLVKAVHSNVFHWCEVIGAGRWCCDVLVFCCSLSSACFQNRTYQTRKASWSLCEQKNNMRTQFIVTDWMQKAPSLWRKHIRMAVIFGAYCSSHVVIVCYYLCVLLCHRMNTCTKSCTRLKSRYLNVQLRLIFYQAKRILFFESKSVLVCTVCT